MNKIDNKVKMTVFNEVVNAMMKLDKNSAYDQLLEYECNGDVDEAIRIAIDSLEQEIEFVKNDSGLDTTYEQIQLARLKELI